jgi:hypothetical protein
MLLLWPLLIRGSGLPLGQCMSIPERRNRKMNAGPANRVFLWSVQSGKIERLVNI